MLWQWRRCLSGCFGNVHCLQVPVRHVRSGQHATVALHPSHLPLQPSQATQQFLQPQISFTALTANGSTTEDPSTVDQRASLQGLVHQQQEQHGQQPAQQQLQETSACSVRAVDASAAGLASSATSTAASGLVSGRQQGGGAAAEQTLPAGLMSQALNRQSQMAERRPWQQQQDPYVLDHRIHHKAGEECSQQQQQLAAATAMARPACSLASDAPVLMPSMTKSATTQSVRTPVPMSASQSVAGAVSSSPTLAGPAPPNARKGMVLLDAAMHTRTVWQFQAVIVLLNGHWPPRGLLSGRWPPKPNTPDTVLSTSLPDSPLGASACTCDVFHHALITRAISSPDSPLVASACISIAFDHALAIEPCLSIAAVLSFILDHLWCCSLEGSLLSARLRTYA